MSVILEFAMFPTDKGESVSAYVAPVIEMIRDSGLNYQLTPMGTIIEADELRDVLNIVERAYSILDELDSQRVYASLKLDIRKGGSDRLKQKMGSIESQIGPVNR